MYQINSAAGDAKLKYLCTVLHMCLYDIILYAIMPLLASMCASNSHVLKA